MARFDVVELSKGRWAVNVQSDLISAVGTIVVVPLITIAADVMPVPRLNPVLSIDGEERILATQLLTVIRSVPRPRKIGSLAEHDYEIKAALDMLLSGF